MPGDDYDWGAAGLHDGRTNRAAQPTGQPAASTGANDEQLGVL